MGKVSTLTTMPGLSFENTRAGSSPTDQSVAHLGLPVRGSGSHWRSKRCIRAVERGLLTNGAEVGIDGDWERGCVWLKRLRIEDRAICRRTNNSSSDLVITGELVQGWDENFAALWIKTMDEASLREWEIQAGVTGCSSLSAFVLHCVHTCGAATDKEWSVLETRESICKIPVRSLERFIAGQFCACKNSLRQTANWSPRRPRVTGCLPRLHARGSDAWRLWSQPCERLFLR